MLYTLTESIVKLAIHGFFRKVHVSGIENLPSSGACIIMANHPSALLDPLIVATVTKRRLHFLAAAEYFGNGLKGSILKGEYNIIPVYRPHMFEGKQVHNDDMFKHCYESLAQDGCIIVFPEGNSITEKHLRPLKTGLGRILMGMKKANPEKEVQVIPLGLNYDNAHRFQSEMLATFGRPITFSNLEPSNEEAEKKQILDITESLHESLKSQILHFDNRELEPVVGRILKVYRSALLKNLEIDQKDKYASFRMEQKLIEAASLLNDSDPEALHDLNLRIKTFLDNTSAKQLDFEQVYKQSSSIAFGLIKLLLFFPVFLLSTLINGIPYLITRRLFSKVYLPKVTDYSDPKGISPAFIGTVAFSLGVSIFLFWFILWSIVISFTTSLWLGPIFFGGAYLIGRFSVRYAGWFISIRRKIRLKKALKKHADELPILTKERAAIIDELIHYQESVIGGFRENRSFNSRQF